MHRRRILGGWRLIGLCGLMIIAGSDRAGLQNALAAEGTAPGSGTVAMSSGPDGDLDVVGLKLGMKRDEIVNTIQARKVEFNGKPLNFVVSQDGKGFSAVPGIPQRTVLLKLSNWQSAYDNTQLPGKLKNPQLGNQKNLKDNYFWDNGSFEEISIQFPDYPNEERASVIARYQRLGQPSHQQALKNALVEKYGPPTVMLDRELRLYWITDEKGQTFPAQPGGHFAYLSLDSRTARHLLIAQEVHARAVGICLQFF